MIWLMERKKTWKSSNNGFQSSWSSERGTRYFFFKSAESTWKTDVVYRGMPRQSRHAYLCKLVQNMGVNILGGEKAKHNLGGQMCWFVMCNYLIQWLIKGCSILAWSWPDNCFFFSFNSQTDSTTWNLDVRVGGRIKLGKQNSTTYDYM